MRRRAILLLSAALLVTGCAWLDRYPYSPDSVNDLAYGGRFRPPAW